MSVVAKLTWTEKAQEAMNRFWASRDRQELHWLSASEGLLTQDDLQVESSMKRACAADGCPSHDVAPGVQMNTRYNGRSDSPQIIWVESDLVLCDSCHSPFCGRHIIRVPVPKVNSSWKLRPNRNRNVSLCEECCGKLGLLK